MQKQEITEITKRLNKLSQICLDIANLCDRAAEEDGITEYISDNLGLGYRALSIYLRSGVKSIIDLQDLYSAAIEKRNIAESSEQSAREFLTEIFGDEDIDSINEGSKERIKTFIGSIFPDTDDESSEK